MRSLGQRLDQNVELLGRGSGLGLLAADVQFDHDTLDDLKARGVFVQFANQADRIHGMDKRDAADNGPGLVALQVPDEMPLGLALECIDLGDGLLDPVLSKRGLARFVDRLDRIKGMLLRHGDQRDILGLSACARGGGGDAVANRFQPFARELRIILLPTHNAQCSIPAENVRNRRPRPSVTQRDKITVIIPTFNEEENLRDCLASVKWADEIFVVDSFSSDRTPEIARSAEVRFVQHEYIDSATQKNWAIPQATHEWVLIVDSDERVTPELREEILQILGSTSQAVGYDIGRSNYFLGKPVRYSGWQNDSCIRLFRRDKGRYQDRQVHADVVIDGEVARTRGRLDHHTFRSFDQYMTKFNRYTTLAARDRATTTRRVTFVHLALRPMARFIRQYFFKLGILDGRTGLIISSLAAYSVFMKYARLWEMRIKEK